MSGIGSANRLGSRTPIVPTLAAAGASTVTLDFDVAVVVAGVPALVTDDGKKATAVTVNSPTEVSILFDGAVTGSASVAFPFEDPAIRDNAGGYVLPSTLSFPGPG